MTKTFLKLKKDSKYSGIELTLGELSLLKIVYDVKILPARSMHLSYEIRYDKQRNPSAISNRLSKLVQAGVLKRIAKPTEYKNIFNYYYKPGNRGYWVLEQAGYLTTKQVEVSKKYRYATKIPPLHNASLSACIVHLMATMEKRGIPLNLIKSSKRGELSSHFLMNASSRQLAEIVPDWVIESEKYLICLEIDTGNQSHSVIYSKYERYRAFLIRKNTEKPVLVIFVSLDKSRKVNSPRLRRIGELKSAFPPPEEWPQNLELFVVPSSRLSDVLIRVLSGKISIDLEMQEELCNTWAVKLIEQFSSFQLRSLPKDRGEIFMNGKMNGTILMSVLSTTTWSKISLATYVEEGSVKSHWWLRKVIERSKSMKSVNGGDNLIINVIYETSEGAEGDVLGIKPFGKMCGVDLESLNSASQEKWSYPFMFQFLTPYTKKKLT